MVPKAADKGNAGIQLNFGVMLRRGEGVAKNYIHAYKCFILVKSQSDNERIEKAIFGSESLMAAGQIAKAQDLAREFKSSICRTRSWHKGVRRWYLDSEFFRL